MSTSPEAQIQADPPSPAESGVGQIYLLLLVAFCLAVIVVPPAMLIGACTGLVATEALFILPAIVYVRAKRLPLAESLAWRPTSLRATLTGAILGVTGVGAAQAISMLLEPMIEPMIGPGPGLDFLRADSPGRLAALIFCGAVLPGVCEETLFRGAVQETLSRFGPAKAIVITSLLFALVHLDPWNFVPILFLGLMLGLLAWRTGSIFPSMIAHAAANATALTLLYWFHDEHDRRRQIVVVTLAVLFAIAFPIFLKRFGHRPVELGPLARAPARFSWRALLAAVGLVLGVMVLETLAVSTATDSLALPYDEPAVGLKKGDQIVMLKPPLGLFCLAEGDIVAFERDGRFELANVDHCDAERVWLADEPGGEPLDRQQIFGRVVRTDRASGSR